MKKRTSKLLSLLLTLTMVVGMLSMGQVAYAAGDVEINAAKFPDANFCAFVQDYDTNSDGKLSEAELAAVTEMDCHGKEIADLTGIEHFTALTQLDCWDNKLTTLDVRKNTALTVLDCADNELTSLDVSRNTALTELWCFGNQLTELDVSANTVLTDIICNNNQLTTLDVSKNIVLERIICYGNQLTTLDVSKNTALTRLDCGNNQLTTLDVSANTALTYLSCPNNQLTTLDVSKNTNLKWLYCYGNNLTTLDVSAVPALKDAVENGTKDTSNSDYDNYSSSKGTLRVDKGFSNIITDTSSLGIAINATNFPDANFRTFVKTYDTDSNGYLSEAELAAVTKMNCVAKDIADLTGIEHFTALTVLDCYDNKLTTLDVNNNTALTELYCYNNQLTSLDVSKNTALTYLDCGTNQLTALDVSANIALTYVRCTDNQLTSLDVSKNTALTMLYCSNNQLTTLDVSKNTQLTTLWCSGNQLTTLDVSANTALTYLWCYNNQLTTLDVSKNTNLKWLHCYGNNLTMLDVSAVPALKDAKENGTKDTSNSDYDNYSSSQGTLRVDKGFTNIITDAPADAATEYPVWVGGTQVTDANKDDILGDGKVSYTPGEGSGTLTITGTPAITGLVEGTLIYADGIDLTINAASGLTLNSTGSGVYVNGDVTINGDASINTTGISINCRGDVTITGSLTATAGGNYTVFSNGNISIGGNAELKNTYSGGYGLCAPNGKITMTSGVWDITAGNYAIYAKNGIEIPGTHEVTTPTGGMIAQVTVDYNFYTVTEADGSTIAAHAVIEPKAAEKFPVEVVITTQDKDGNVISTVGGTATADKTEVARGETITVTVTPNAGFELESVEFSDGVTGGYKAGTETSSIVPDDFTTSTGKLQIDVIFKVVTPEPAQKYTITYTDGVVGKEIFADVVFTDVEEGSATPTISNPTRSGYTFTGWTPAVAATVTGDQTYTATWDKNSTGGGIVIPTVFPVTVKESDNGEVEASAKYAVPGSTVKLPVTPDEGYELDTLIVKSGSKFINVTEKNGKYQFVMPFGSATVTATFKAVNPYNDVDTDDWFYDDVLYVTLKDLMNGTGNGKFSPEITTDRAMLVTVLWRLEGCPVVDSSVDFDDVADGLWYSDAIDWASANGIVNGYGDGKFGPTDQITREQIMAILNRYAAYKNWTDDTALPMIPQYNCSIWAENNVIWADMNGLLNGLGVDITDMTAKASRAELAAYLARFMQNIVK